MKRVNSSNRLIVLTGNGTSALATLRLVGPLVPEFLARHVSRPARPGRLVHAELSDAEGIIDDPVIALSADSRFVDITLHGGAWVVEAAMACAVRAGFERVNPLEHPREVFPDATDVLDAELQIALPGARTELAARVLLAQPAAWRAWADFLPDADSIEAVIADRWLYHLLHPPSVAIVGLPNAGKSTLANQLFGTQRSIVSPVPGTTRDWVGEEANLDGLIVTLLDTPGRHDTPDPIERQAIEQSHAPVDAAALRIVLLDASRAFSAQAHLVDLTADQILLANKMDLALPEWTDAFLASRGILPLVAQRPSDIRNVTAAICRFFDPAARAFDAPRCWTARQARCLRSVPLDISSIIRG